MTWKYVDTPAHKWAPAPTHPGTYIATHPHTHMPTYSHTHILTHQYAPHTDIHTHILTHPNAHTPTYSHAHILIHPYTHTQKRSFPSYNSSLGLKRDSCQGPLTQPSPLCPLTQTENIISVVEQELCPFWAKPGSINVKSHGSQPW